MRQPLLVSNMPHASENHSHAMLIGRCNHFLILNRAPRLNDRFGPRLRRLIDTVTKRIEGIRGHYGSPNGEAVGLPSAPQFRF